MSEDDIRAELDSCGSIADSYRAVFAYRAARRAEAEQRRAEESAEARRLTRMWWAGWGIVAAGFVVTYLALLAWVVAR